MEEDRLIDLITKKVSSSLTGEESKELESMITSSHELKAIHDELIAKWEEASNYKIAHHHSVDQSWAKLNEKIDSKKATFSIPLLARVAALLVMAVGIGYYFLSPGTKEVVYITQPNEQIEITLPDSSKIYLNENSRISYLENFNEDRYLRFEGEAFFDVRRDEAHPFVIHNDQVNVEVLGTSFNVDAYRQSDYAAVTVASGKVSLKNNRNGEFVLLTKGMYGALSKVNGSLTSTDLNTKNANSWRTRVLSFENTPLNSVILDIERYFGKPIIIDDNKVGACRFTSSFQDPTLDEVLEIISATMGLQLEATTSGYVLKGEGCNQFN